MAFNSLHTALEAAVNTLLATGLCAEIDLVMSPNFEVESNIISAAAYRIECVEEVDAITIPMKVTFTPPLTREDGTELFMEDIIGYEIEFDGNCARGWTLTAEGKSSEYAMDCVGDIE